MHRVTVAVPSLGPRGEGWVAAQLLLFAAIGAAGVAGGAGVDVPGAGAGNPGPLTVVPGTAILVAGLLIVARGALDLGSNLTPFPRPRAATTLVESGSYRWVRHPIYSGVVLAGSGWSVATASPLALLLTALLALLFDAKSRREERWLAERLPGYAAYRARTRKFIPGLY